MQDSETVPLFERFVSKNHGIFAWSPGTIVPESPRSLVRTNIPLSTFLGVVPDLNLRGRFQVDAAVRLGHCPVVNPQLIVLERVLGRQINAFPVIDQRTVLHGPMGLHVRLIFKEERIAVLVAHRCQLIWIKVAHATPTREIFPVEQSAVPLGRLIVFLSLKV